MLGKECNSCLRVLGYRFFDRDSSYKDGRKDQCSSCQSQPRLSLAEHTSRLMEQNVNSEAVRSQRWAHQDELKDDLARIGKPMRGRDFIRKVQELVPNLYVTEGRIIGDLAVFQTYPCPQTKLEGRDFQYLWYVPEGVCPEYSVYEFDHGNDIAIREKMRGWRTCLLRLVKSGMLTESQCDKHFGRASGKASTRWYRELFKHRNQVSA